MFYTKLKYNYARMPFRKRHFKVERKEYLSKEK